MRKAPGLAIYPYVLGAGVRPAESESRWRSDLPVIKTASVWGEDSNRRAVLISNLYAVGVLIIIAAG